VKIAIVGRGSVAKALRRGLRQHETVFAVRQVVAAGEHPIPEAAQASDVMILATPWSAMADVAAALAPHVDGKPIIDATNPVGMTEKGMVLVNGHDASGAEALQAALPKARVVKCFNQIGAELIADPGLLATPPVMFAAGDDPAARDIALSLAQDIGFAAVSAGPLCNAGLLEHLAHLWIWNAMKGELGRGFGFAISHQKT